MKTYTHHAHTHAHKHTHTHARTHTQPQSNPVLSIPDSILTEDEEPMATGSGAGGGAEEEEGVVSDPGTEITSNEDEKLKVGF